MVCCKKLSASSGLSPPHQHSQFLNVSAHLKSSKWRRKSCKPRWFIARVGCLKQVWIPSDRSRGVQPSLHCLQFVVSFPAPQKRFQSVALKSVWSSVTSFYKSTDHGPCGPWSVRTMVRASFSNVTHRIWTEAKSTFKLVTNTLCPQLLGWTVFVDSQFGKWHSQVNQNAGFGKFAVHFKGKSYAPSFLVMWPTLSELISAVRHPVESRFFLNERYAHV